MNNYVPQPNSRRVSRRTVLYAPIILISLVFLSACAHVGVKPSQSVGNGAAFMKHYALTVSPTGDLYVVDRGLRATIHVDPKSGDRTIVSNAQIGTGQ